MHNGAINGCVLDFSEDVLSVLLGIQLGSGIAGSHRNTMFNMSEAKSKKVM